MCKSAAEGGQRCHGHARKAVEAAEARLNDLIDDVVDGKTVPQKDIDEARAKMEKALIGLTSTIEGSEQFRTELANMGDEARETDPEGYAACQRLINEGAKHAQVNREVENAYRATQGKPPLTTPLPQTLEQEATAQAAADKAAADKAAKEADPFGLRIEQAARGIEAVGDADATAAIIAEASAEQAALEASTDGPPPEAIRLRGEYVAALNTMQTVTAAVGRGEADEDALLDAHEDVVDAMVNYASTNEGAADMYATLHALNPAAPDYEDQAESVLSIIDEGAQKAQRRRARENASRATRGLPPLTTPVPQTLEQLEAKAKAMSNAELETARARLEAAGSKLVGSLDGKADDPFGLRAEARSAH